MFNRLVFFPIFLKISNYNYNQKNLVFFLPFRDLLSTKNV